MTIEPSLPDMLLFAAVVREASFTRAAAKLGITKQSASARLTRLETQLGARLLERTTRRMRPTDLGAVYFERCQLIAAAVDEANQEVRSRQASPTGSLRIAAPVLFGRRFLAPIVAAYARDFPSVHVEIVLGNRRRNLVEEGFDLAIRVGALDDSTLSARRLGTARVSTVASPRFLATCPVDAPEALSRVACIGMQTVEDWWVAGKRRRIRPRLVVNDLELAADAALAHVGVAHLPELVTRDHLRARRLRRVCETTPLTVPVFAVYPSRQFLPLKVRAFVERLGADRAI